MKKRRLRSIGVSEVGMGCMAFSHGYGQIPDEPYSIEAIRNAFRHGCTFFFLRPTVISFYSAEKDRRQGILSQATIR